MEEEQGEDEDEVGEEEEKEVEEEEEHEGWMYLIGFAILRRMRAKEKSSHAEVEDAKHEERSEQHG